MTALLVIDMQNHFSSIAELILPALHFIVDLCRAAGVPILYTRHHHHSPERYDMLGEWWAGDLIFDGTSGAELLPDIGRWDGDCVVEKSTYSEFAGTSLEQTLRDLKVEEVIVTGVMTNLCCETTRRRRLLKGLGFSFSLTPPEHQIGTYTRLR